MAREHLDISIENLDKVPNKLALLIRDTVTVTEKVDGTKLTIIRNDQPWDPDVTKNWIVSYKSNIINAEDFAGLNARHDAAISSHSTGISQYKFVWDGLRKAHVHCKQVPRSTEFFIEFVMRKGTLTRVYEKYHAMILIATSPTHYSITGGKVYSSPSSFDTTHNDQFAKLLGIQTARVLYDGPLSKLVNVVGPAEMVAELKSKFLGMSSQFGGKMEGVVLEFSSGATFKLVQDDQYDKATRAANKASTEAADPAAYWGNIRQHAQTHLAGINPNDDFKRNVEMVSQRVYGSAHMDVDANKHDINAKDDTFLTAKSMLMRQTPGNNGAMFLGRMSPLTIAHHGIIENALKTYDTVTVNLVKAKVDKSNPFPVELQKQMLELCFGNRIEVIVSQTGNLATILQKSKHMINVILAGTDRVEGYRSQLGRSPDISVIEIPRTNEVSGTLVRGFLLKGDMEGFKRYTPACVWPLYAQLKQLVEAQQ